MARGLRGGRPDSPGFLVGPPLIGLVSEALTLKVGLGIVVILAFAVLVALSRE